MELPEIFDKKLNRNSFYDGAIHTTLNKFSQIFAENRLYFFEEYTDHSERHITAVLKACCDELITSDTYNLLTEKDISILVLAVFLHDLGMHLQPLTFNAMVCGGYDDVLNKDFEDEKWSVLWENYLFEAKKFNDQQRKNLFGDVDVHITEPDLSNPDSLTGIHKKLIGEFIRRHHPRIAFEVAFKGLTTHEGTQIDFCSDFDDDHKLLAGLLARSHGMNIRDTFPFLHKHFHGAWKRPLEVHIVYLMTVLRLADYFQIDGNRVLRVPYLTKQFKSPVSFAEHEKHLQTKYIQPLPDDPETLFVTANPENSTFFLALEKLFNDIQKELDNSWAVLGEIYGLKPYEEQPKLRVRRICSNLDDKKSFETKVPYVPEKISFTVDKEIPKLLVGPLYDYDPSYGVRELLQNAVDACWEREFYEQKISRVYKSAISITIEPLNNQYLFSIKDNGKGMTLDEIKNYFLKIGGSFRKSAKWKNDHVDDEGHSNVNKSGRFGIGVLAAYLLGTEIEVITKSLFSSIGYSFKTTLEQEQVEIKKQLNIQEGTIVNIKITKKIFKDLTEEISEKDYPFYDSTKLRFDKWYILKSPKITFKLPEFIKGKVGYERFFPGINDKLNNQWHEIYDENYKKIIWSYQDYYHGVLVCNGIVIPLRYDFENEDIQSPTILMFDFDAKLAINLNRTFVNNSLSFEEKLEKDIYKDFIAKVLLAKVNNVFHKDHILIGQNSIEHPFLKIHEHYYNRRLDFISRDPSIIVYCKNGFALNHPVFFNKLCGLNCLRVFVYGSLLKNKQVNLYHFNIVDADIVSLTILRDVDLEIQRQSTGLASYLFRNNNLDLIGWTDDLHSKKSNIGLKEINIDRDIQKEFMPDGSPSKDISLIYSKIKDTAFKTTLFNEVVSDLLGDDLIIPYNIEDRKKKFPKAFAQLEPYMRKYLKEK